MDNQLDALIKRLTETEPLSEAEARKRSRHHGDRMIALALARADDISNARDLGDFVLSEGAHLSILKQPEEDFRSELRSIDNDLLKQVGNLQEGFDLWFEHGAVVPPYYAWRIAVILAKAKRPEDERAFLAAWCRHFGRKVGGRFSALAERARKRGVEI